MSHLANFKRHAKVLLRTAHDAQERNMGRFCQKETMNTPVLSHQFTISQEIKPSATFANKIHNLSEAGQRINPYILLPNEIFSFWRVVGNPEQGFKSSRSIIKGKTVEEIGGGICQVSGILYLASIHAGLPILERYPHSLDLYTDETRFTPLGTDATVVYGYKDLRVCNAYDFAIKLLVRIEHGSENEKSFIHVDVLSEQPIAKQALVFKQITHANSSEVWVTSEGRTINHSIYQKPSTL